VKGGSKRKKKSFLTLQRVEKKENGGKKITSEEGLVVGNRTRKERNRKKTRSV